MVFKGAGDRSAREIVEVIEAEGGQINAATGYERTSFQVRALRGGLELGFDLIADLIQRPTLKPDDLAREKPVIAQEIAEAADTPDDLVFELAQGAAFGDHPLGRPILGTDASVGAATPDALSAFHRSLYAPDAIVISAAGAVNEGELLALAEARFGRGDGHAGAALAKPAAFVGGEIAVARRLEQAHVVLLLPAVGSRHPDYFTFRLFAEILGGGMSSRLFQEVRENRGLAYAIDAYADTHADTGVLGVYLGAAAADAAQAADVTAGEIAAMAKGVTEGELARAKAQMKSATFMARESTLARAEIAGGQTMVFDRLYTVAETAAEIDRVTAADIAAFGARVLAPGLCATAVLGAKRAGPAGARFRRALFG
jgi:predicted Zn-dependent peptidase